MSKLNPFSLIILLMALLAFVMIKEHQLQNDLLSQHKRVHQLEKTFMHLSNLKSQWDNSPNKTATLLKNPLYKDANIVQESLGDKTSFTAGPMQPDKARQLFNKLLNAPILLHKIALEKEGQAIKVRVEVRR